MTVRRTRVLIVYPHLPHYRLSVFNALDARAGLDVTFASSTSGRDGIATMPPSAVKRHTALMNRYVGNVLWQHGLTRLVATSDFDVIVLLGNAAHVSSWLAALIARARRRKVVFWTIGWHRPDAGLRKAVRLAFYRLGHQLWLYGDRGRRIGIEMGFPADRLVVVRNSNDLHSVGQTFPAAAEKSATVGLVARLTPAKRVEQLIQAVAVLRGHGFPVKVALAGEGPATSGLRSLASRLRVPVDFVGPLYDSADLSAFYAPLSVTCIPAAAGLSVIQSLGHGVPVVTDDDDNSQMPEAEAVVPGLTGSRFVAGDIDDLARKLQFWIGEMATRPHDVAAACRAEIDARWNAETQVELMLDGIDRLALSSHTVVEGDHHEL